MVSPRSRCASIVHVLGWLLSLSSAAVVHGGTGDVIVSVTWTQRLDVDLHVEDPNGYEVWDGAPTSPDGGSLIVRNDSGGTATSPAMEEIAWPTGAAPNGNYTVWVVYANTGLDTGPVDCTVSVTASAQVMSWHCTLTTLNDMINIKLFTEPTAQAFPSFHVDGRSIWVWSDAYYVAGGNSSYPYSPSAGSNMLKYLGSRRIEKVYFLFDPSNMVWSYVQSFIQLASAQSPPIQVYALTPGSLQGQWYTGFPVFQQAPVLNWTQAVQSYNAASAPATRFSGIMMDIEPWTSSNWNSSTTSTFLSALIDLYSAVKGQLGGTLPYAAALPYWLRNYSITWHGVYENAGALALDALTYGSIMDYRGDNLSAILNGMSYYCAHAPGRVECIQDTNPKDVEGGVALYVSTNSHLESYFRALLWKYGSGLMESIHKDNTYQAMPR